jgi:exopolysaccharide biosynthesis polyprenyl glycosylphosphotransferase
MRPKINRRKLIMMFLGVVDVLATLVTLFLASYLVHRFTYEQVIISSEIIFVSLIVLITWLVLLKATHLARIPRTRTTNMLFSDFVKLSFIGGIILMLLDWMIKFDSFPSMALALFIVLNFFVLFAIRYMTFKTVKYFRANGHNTRNIVVIANDQSASLIHKILHQKEWGFKILYIISDSEVIKSQFGNLVKIHPKSVNVKSLLRFDIIDEVICFDCLHTEKRLYELIDYCSDLGVTFRLHGKQHIVGNFKTRQQYFDTIPLFTIENNPINKFHQVTKMVLEISASFVILFMSSPVLLLISLLIKLTSKGPIVFKQERVGLRGRKFYIYKFRTMVINAEELKEKLMVMNESDGPTFKIKKDPRITTIGSILRKTNLDEVPQLFNVIKGEMSLIGPRPPIQSEVDRYEEWQLKRLAVKPGLTCTWQIVPNRNDVKFDKWVQMDIQYIDNWSLKADVALFFKTFKTVLFARGA